MKHVAVLLCIFGLAAVCLGQGTTTPSATTADATTVSSPGGTPAATTTAAAGAGSGTTAAGSATTAAGGTAAGGVVTTDAGTGAPTATTVSCLNCTGDGNSACGTATGITTKVDCDECWVYREENAAGNVTITRGCAQGSDTCTADNESENCNTANSITTCRRCCTTADCNGSGLTLTGNSGAGDVTASVVVTMATALFAIVALWQ